jgi:hypothetical protein
MANTITSANSGYILVIPGVFPSGVQLQGYRVDEAFDTEAVDAIETQIGVDGTGVGGWIPREIPQTVTLLGSSPSNDVFEQWQAAQDAIQEVIYASGVIRLPSLSKQFSMARGVFKRPKPIADVKKVIQPQAHVITWLPQPVIPAIVKSPL